MTAESAPRGRYLADNPRFLAAAFMSPAVIYIIALVGFPFVLAIVYAFTNISTGNPDLEFVGWATFQRVLADPVFRQALWNTFLFAVIANLFVVVGATALAEILTFVGILFVGLVYVWVKRDLEWLKKVPVAENGDAARMREAA